MKLPDFNEFIKVRGAGKFDHIKAQGTDGLPPNLTPDRVVSFARETAELTTVLVLQQYHKWLDEQLVSRE